MIIPVNYICACNLAGRIFIDEDATRPGACFCSDCECKEYTICVTIKSIDKESRKWDIAISVGRIETQYY